MSDDSFLLVNLKEDKAKELAQVISNDTCRKILNFLAKKEATESEIAKRLNIPISTVHYNLKHLKAAKLVQADEFHYSEKGKEVDHYKLANKLIIIAPKETPEGFGEKLKKFLPVSIIILAATAIIQLFESMRSKAFSAMSEQGAALMEASKAATQADMTAEAIPRAASAAQPSIEVIMQVPAAVWFLIGAVFSLIVYLLVSKLMRKN
ncbi:ArsR family transcriptional regulator [Candidatus Woesearchaeota archaeon]|nr:MAG: ArsR family transcriptional regulator [Candidatus Woesearchaeota archaeon]